MIHVHAIPFGALKEWLGPSELEAVLPEGTTVAMLLERLRVVHSGDMPEGGLDGIAVAVNAEYARCAQILQDGDEVGLLPPVSGGASELHAGHAIKTDQARQTVLASVTRQPIHPPSIVGAAKQREDGAVIVFDGVVPDTSHGRAVHFADYEAYEKMVVRQARNLGKRACEQFGVRHVSVTYRLGRIKAGETSELIVVTSEHRTAAFEACCWLVDQLKKTVPIWKKETFTGGAAWAQGEPFPGDLAVGAQETKHAL